MSNDPLFVREKPILLVEARAPSLGGSHVLDTMNAAAEELRRDGCAVRLLHARQEKRFVIYAESAPEEFDAYSQHIRMSLEKASALDIDVSRLILAQSFSGASSDSEARYHYVVRTDVLPGAESELIDWYDTEHMPGLASVPGVVLAERLISIDTEPRYYARYDLVSPAVREHPDWLAARATEWSDKVRVTFRDTRRTVYDQEFNTTLNTKRLNG